MTTDRDKRTARQHRNAPIIIRRVEHHSMRIIHPFMCKITLQLLNVSLTPHFLQGDHIGVQTTQHGSQRCLLRLGLRVGLAINTLHHAISQRIVFDVVGRDRQ